MKSFVAGVYTKMVPWFVTLIFAMVMLLSLLQHHATSCHGSNGASTSLKVGGGRARSRNSFYNQSKLEMSGSTK
jgi:hypothetical protein